jgi:glutamate/tyrosine decarboxylase-like PLP-dependent enzyme
VTKIQPSLAKRVAVMKLDRPEDVIPVIVTVAPGVDTAAMESRGLKVQRTLESVSAVAGTVAAGEIENLAALDEVRAIEYDGEIRAL